MGPVERAIHTRLSQGESISRARARRELGPLAQVFLDRMVKRGAAIGAGDLVSPKIRAAPTPAILAIEARERQAAADREQVAATAKAEQQLRDEQRRAEAKQRAAERRDLMREIDAAATPADRQRIVRQAQAQARAKEIIAKLPPASPDPVALGALFDIDMDT